MPSLPKNLTKLMSQGEADAFTQMRSKPGQQANAAMLTAMKPTIERAVRTYAGSTDAVMMSHGRRLALQAAQSYDPNRGARLSTHIHNQLRGLQRISGKHRQVLSVPERVALDRRALTAAEDAMEAEVGRPPTADELATRTGLSIKRQHHVRRFQPATTEGYLSQIGEPGAGGLTPRVSTGPSMIDLATESVYDDMDPINKKIMDWALGLHGHQMIGSNAEVARRLNLSPGAVSQRKLAIQNKLDEAEQIAASM